MLIDAHVLTKVTYFLKTRCKTRKKLKNLNLTRNGKIVILSKWDRLKPVTFIDLG